MRKETHVSSFAKATHGSLKHCNLYHSRSSTGTYPVVQFKTHSNMKLPHQLLKTYRRYKEDEQDLLEWIESTAVKSGFKPPGQQTKLSGRARPLVHPQKLKSHVKTREGDRFSNKEVTISILEIIPLVTTIVQCPRIISVPEEIVGLLRTIIELRKACVEWFRQNTNQNDSETRRRNENHIYPLTVLQAAVSILEPKFPAKRPAKYQKVKPAENTKGNAFVLKTHQPEASEPNPKESHLASDESRRSPPSNVAQTLRMNEQEQIQDEFDLAKFCMLSDIQEIEDFIVLELVRYSLDQANADVLPFLSNAAIDIVAKMGAALREQFDQQILEHGCHEATRTPKVDLLQSPLVRMQGLISSRLRGPAKSSSAEAHHYHEEVFHPEVVYFGAPVVEQAKIEKSFINHVFHLHRPADALGEYLVTVDYTFESMRQLFSSEIRQHKRSTSVGIVFAIRIAFLTTLLLKDHREFSLIQLKHTASKFADLAAARDELWKSSLYRSRRIESIRLRLGPEPANTKNLHLACVPSVRISNSKIHLSQHHLTSAWNDSLLRMIYANDSIRAMEKSNVVKVLAHLWNLLHEEAHLDVAWPDMQYLLAVLGEDYMFQSERPTLARNGSKWIRERMMFCMNFMKDTTASASSRVTPYSDVKEFVPHEFRYGSSSTPVYTLLSCRDDGSVGSPDRAVDLELIVTAAVVSGIIEQTSQLIDFDQGGTIKNRSELWKVKDQRPDLQPVELLALTKRALLKEFRVLNFDYFALERTTLELAKDTLSLHDEVPAEMKVCPHAFGILEFTAQGIYVYPPGSPILSQLAAMFKRWLESNGHVGVQGLNITEQRPINPKSLLSSLRPEVLVMVKKIVEMRGLREDVFSKD